MASDYPHHSEYAPYYRTYLENIEAIGLVQGLRDNFKKCESLLLGLPADKHEYQYAVGKWTIKEMVQHLIDSERIFAYRALRIARNDQTPLPGFDQNEYVPPSKANSRNFDGLIEEYRAVRLSTVNLFDSFDAEMLVRVGTASNYPVSVRALGYIIMGHENHHCNIISERYL
ncbi:MAG TPA: DinB family protein [Aquaticitalea sp.]|nr:DinB family protein [Aquaticitalea sp.]